MRWNHRVTNLLVSCLVVGGATALFFLPVVQTATTPPDPSIGGPPPEPTAYTPDVQQLIETTYLGRGKEFPDLGEPAIVLRKYLEQNAHGYHAQLAKQGQKLNAELAEWQALTRQYPQSRHAFVALGKYYRTKAQASGDIAYTRQAADAYIQAAEIGLAHGHIRYTRELSELLVELGDRKGLDEIFGRLLAQPTDLDRDFYYLALVDYADGLARFSDDRAWGYFEQAIDLHPENNEAAINLYAQYLLTRGYPQKAFELLDTRLTPEQRVNSVVQAFLRKQAMEQAGLDTASADEEIALIRQ